MAVTNVVTKAEAGTESGTPSRTLPVQNVRVQKNMRSAVPANDPQFTPSRPKTPEEIYTAAEGGQNDLGEFYKKTKAREDADRRALTAFAKKTRDTERGIKNAQSRTASGYSESSSPEILDKTIEEQFIEQKSIAARADKRRWGIQKALREEQDSREGEPSPQFESQPTPTNTLRSRVGIQSALAAQFEQKGALLSKKLTGSTRWWLVGILSILYVWQLIFALLSLVGFGLDGIIKESYLGKAVGIFINVEKLFPAIYLGYGAWGICTILSISTFLILALWYQLNRIDIFGDIITTTITLLFLTLSILPISNLFPCLLIWVLCMNTKSLFSST